MLRPKAVEAYDETLNSVVSDLIAKLHLRRRSGGLVTDIASEFYRFGLEGEISHGSGTGSLARHHAACDRMLALVMRSSYYAITHVVNTCQSLHTAFLQS